LFFGNFRYPNAVSRSAQPGIYVEIPIRSTVDRIWHLTQTPDLHERWDLRFHTITYLPRPDAASPQRFLYETRIGFGLAIRGEGESVGQVSSGEGETTSSLKFSSDDVKSLIREGSGYWRYIPAASGIRFLTWYDYQVRFGLVGRLLDRLAFRPLMGWATAWSFDRLRLWAEKDQSPESSRNLWIIHALARLTIAFVWIWHGLVPKLLFHHPDELATLREAHLSTSWLPLVGAAEIGMGILNLVTWKFRPMLLADALCMLLLTACVAVYSPEYLTAAFNPVTLNLSVLMLCVIGWLASGSTPSAGRCLRRKPRGER
jgi:hypothetical protein